MRPGETPPDSAGAGVGVAHREPRPSRVAPVLSYVFVGLVVLAVVALAVVTVTGMIHIF